MKAKFTYPFPFLLERLLFFREMVSKCVLIMSVQLINSLNYDYDSKLTMLIKASHFELVIEDALLKEFTSTTLQQNHV